MKKLLLTLLFFTLTISSSAQTKTKDLLLFEIESFSSSGGGGMGMRRSSKSAYFIYQSGRIACKSLSYNPQGKEIGGNKSKCLQISQTKINELIKLAEQDDFQTADYQYFEGGVDWGKSFSITYFGKNGKKEINLTNPRQTENTAQIPPSLERFLTKLGEISDGLKVEYELK